MATSFGIHVGNTSACLAVSKDGKTDVVASPTGDRVTPAVVSFTDTEIIVGLAAKQGRIRNMANTVTNNKRLLVRRADQEDIDKNPVTIVENDGQYFYEVDYKEKEFRTTPSAILSHIYRYLHNIADTHCKDVDDSNCVLTVPLDYTAEERNLISKAAAEVGFKVVQVISEPAAACLAYGIGQLDQGEGEHILVYRVGGLTTDLSLVQVAGGCYSVQESVSIDGLGGHQITEVLVKFLGGEFKAKYKEDILQNKKGKAKLATQAETVKHVLSTLDTAHCYVESLFDGMDFSSNVTRARFDNQLSPVLTDLMAPISALLTKAELSSGDVTKVVLVGGSAKVVKLQNALSAAFPQAQVLNSLPPDEVLAYGAAVQASYINRDMGTGPREKMLAVSCSILAKVVGGETVPLIVAATPIPVKRSVPLVVVGDSITVELVWEASNESSVTLATLTLETTPSSKISISFHIHRDGSSHAVLQDKTAGTSTDVMLHPAGSS